MPVRLTPTKSLLISYDAPSDSWVTLDGLSLCILGEYVDIEPGVTVENLFDLIDADNETKRFLSEFCSCDIDAIRALPPKLSGPITVGAGTKTLDDGSLVVDGETNAHEMHIHPFYYAFNDEMSRERRLEGTNLLMARSRLEGSLGEGIGKKVNYADIKHLELRLDPRLWIDECELDDDADDDAFFSARIRYKLIDVLVAVVGHFGMPAFDPRYQPEVEEHQRIRDQFRRKFPDNESDDGPSTEGEP